MVVVPIRVNLNLKAMTVDELIARRKVVPHSILPSFPTHMQLHPSAFPPFFLIDRADHAPTRSGLMIFRFLFCFFRVI